MSYTPRVLVYLFVLFALTTFCMSDTGIQLSNLYGLCFAILIHTTLFIYYFQHLVPACNWACYDMNTSVIECCEGLGRGYDNGACPMGANGMYAMCN